MINISPRDRLILEHVARGNYYTEAFSRIIRLKRRQYYAALQRLAKVGYLVKYAGGASGAHYEISELGRVYLHERL